MIIFIIIMTAIVFFFILWLFMIKPNKKRHPLSDEFKKYSFAHRGLHDDTKTIPENSMAAFRRAIVRGYGIELDLHTTKDKSLAVIHDTSLLRTANADIDITELSDNEVKNYRLEGSGERIPFFGEVLYEIKGRVPLLIELKIDRSNYAELCEKTLEALKEYKGIYAIQSFDPRAVKYLKEKHPDIMRGQLSGYLRKSGTDLHPVLDFCLRNLLTNFLTRPHFISYRVQDSARFTPALCRTVFSPLEFNWTIREKREFEKAEKNNAVPIFEKKDQ